MNLYKNWILELDIIIKMNFLLHFIFFTLLPLFSLLYIFLSGQDRLFERNLRGMMLSSSRVSVRIGSYTYNLLYFAVVKYILLIISRNKYVW